ncbi:hypothetical protein TWF481_010076 [Arthrobotrys musiformis]|uniref:Uncharacterized protein n=1 Tax=Arthrobotrys musiformis TaxID=47236 RepID=A0AAV9VZU6_9PEZI
MKYGPDFTKFRGTDSMLLVVNADTKDVDCLTIVDGSRETPRDDAFDLKEAAKIPREMLAVIIKYIARENEAFEKSRSGVAFAVGRLQYCENGDAMAVVRLVEAQTESEIQR